MNNIFENINFSSEMILCRQWMDRRRFSRLFLILSAHILKIKVHWISRATFYYRFSHTRLKLNRFGRMPKIYSFLKLNQQNNTWKILWVIVATVGICKMIIKRLNRIYKTQFLCGEYNNDKKWIAILWITDVNVL